MVTDSSRVIASKPGSEGEVGFGSPVSMYVHLMCRVRCVRATRYGLRVLTGWARGRVVRRAVSRACGSCVACRLLGLRCPLGIDAAREAG